MASTNRARRVLSRVIIGVLVSAVIAVGPAASQQAQQTQQAQQAQTQHGLDDGPEFVIDPDEASVNLEQMFVSIVGDIDADGTNDFLITSAWSAVNGARSGRMFILSGKR